MKRSTQKSILRFWLEVIGVVFVLAASLSPSAQAQTNTFPSSGNVGVGTTSPGEKLVTVGNILGGNITAPTLLYPGYDSQANVILELGYGTATSNIVPLPSLVLSKNLTSSNNALGVISFANSSIANGNEKRLSAIGSWTDGATNSGALLFFTNGAGTLAERMRISSVGNVGIGVTSPGVHAKLEVNGAGAPDYAIFSDWLNSTLRIGRSGTTLQLKTDASQNLALMPGGKLGIGTTNPIYSLDVNGGTNGFRATAASTSSSDTIATFENSSGIQAIVRANGNVGIGTTSPTNKLQVVGNVVMEANAGGTSGVALMGLDANNAYLQVYDSTRALRVYLPSKANVNGYFDNGGNFGIGTNSPTKKLDVVGDITASGAITGGTINAKYQDVAEWVESSQSLAAGTVVVLDHTRSNQVVASSRAYDTRVAGVISLRPGIALGESGDSKVLVATTGRVKIKVDASAGPIQIGDLLVTSDKEGVAKKSEPLNLGGVQIHRPGTLIGKALEPLAKGTGEILVLLSLQ